MTYRTTKHYDAIIIGAGAAGLMCAGQASQRGLKTAVIEHTNKPAEKIRISGGGRCNFTNLDCAPERFISQNPDFCRSALSRYTQHDFIDLLRRHEIPWHEKKLGQLFCNDSARNIIDMLLKESSGAEIKTGTSIRSVRKDESVFHLETSSGDMTCTSLVIATGGLSVPKAGATSFGYDIARQFGINVIPPKPALVPLTFDADFLEWSKGLSGIAIDPARVSCNNVSFDEAILFTHRGLSGPSILQISSYWDDGDTIIINLSPQQPVIDFMKSARKMEPRKQVKTVLSALMPQRIAEEIIRQTGAEGDMANLSDKVINALGARINDWAIQPSGTEGYRTAEVTRGGVDTDELSSKTLESRKIPGLYFIGEIVDVTGWLGGYNFQWAWSSGWVCAQTLRTP